VDVLKPRPLYVLKPTALMPLYTQAALVGAAADAGRPQAARTSALGTGAAGSTGSTSTTAVQAAGVSSSTGTTAAAAASRGVRAGSAASGGSNTGMPMDPRLIEDRMGHLPFVIALHVRPTGHESLLLQLLPQLHC
jgi:hypothetical protein